MRKQWQQWLTLFFLGYKITADYDCSPEIKRCLVLGRKAMTNLDSILKNRAIILPTTVHLVKAIVFPQDMYGCDLNYKESWMPKNWCFWTVMLEKTWESLDCKEIQLVHPKGDQSWVFIGGTHVEAETPILCPPDVKSWLIWKDPDAGKEWGQEEKGRAENEMVVWHHQHNGHGFGWTLGVGNGLGGLVYCGSWGWKESNTTQRLNWTELLGMKVMTNLDSILKSRDITLSTKVHVVKAMVFPVVMHGCKIWTIKKAERWRFDAFELSCWRRLFRVFWTARRSNQWILKEISSGCLLEGLIWSWHSSILATWCDELTHLKRPWCWERLKAGGEGDDRG